MLAYRGKRVAVIGATGFIGSHLVEKLVSSGAEVLGVGRSAPASGSPDLFSKITFAHADIRDNQRISEIFAAFRPQKVFHMAAHPDSGESFTQMRECIRQNTEAVLNVLEASAQAQAETFVFSDSSKVFGNASSPYSEQTPDNPVCSYAIAKAAAWKLCKLYSSSNPTLRVAALRPTLVYGPRQKLNLISFLCSRMDRGEPVSIQGGWQTRDPLHIHDAVDAYLRIGMTPEANGHAIPIGGGEEMTVKDICGRVLDAFGSKLPLNFDSESLRSTEIFRSSCDNTDALQLLGWKPCVSFREGLRDLAELRVASRTSISLAVV